MAADDLITEGTSNHDVYLILLGDTNLNANGLDYEVLPSPYCEISLDKE